MIGVSNRQPAPQATVASSVNASSVNRPRAAASGGTASSKTDAATNAGKTQHAVLEIVETIVDEATKAAFPGLDIPAAEVMRTKNAKLGDYQCNSAMAIFTALKGTPNAVKTPRNVATKIVAAIPENA